MTTYDGRVAVVTGAASGIGLATARRLGELGATVVGLDRTTGADVRDRPSIEAALAGVDRVDALFNCAGVTGASGPVTTLAVNVLGLRRVTDVVLGRMPDGGSITNVGSIAGWGWERDFDEVTAFLAGVDDDGLAAWCATHPALLAPSPYNFSKRCVVVETMLRAAELAPRQVRVNAITPSAVDTPMLALPTVNGPRFISDFPSPYGRMTTADEQAAVLTFLGGPEAAAVSGAVVATDHSLLAGVRVNAIPNPFPDA